MKIKWLVHCKNGQQKKTQTKKNKNQKNQSQDDDSDYSDAPKFSNVPEFKCAAISYITGYVAQMAQKKTTCHVCHEAIGSREHECESAFLTLKHRKFV